MLHDWVHADTENPVAKYKSCKSDGGVWSKSKISVQNTFSIYRCNVLLNKICESQQQQQNELKVDNALLIYM